MKDQVQAFEQALIQKSVNGHFTLPKDHILDDEFRNVLFRGSIENGSFSCAIFRNCVFERFSFKRTCLARCQFVDCTFKDFELEYCQTQGAIGLELEQDRSR